MNLSGIISFIAGSRLIKAAFAALIAVITDRIIIGSIIKNFIRAARARNPENAPKMHTLFSVLRTLLTIIIYFIAAVSVMQILFDINAASIIAATGVVGVVAGLGAQSIVKDSISGFFILLENQYAVGDLVTVDDFTGYVESVTIRTTVIKDFEGSRLIIPNGNMTRIVNHSRDGKSVLVRVHISYDESVDRAMSVIRGALADAAEDMTDLTGEARLLGVDELGPVSVRLLITARCKTGTQYEVNRELLRRIKNAFDKNGIKMPLQSDTRPKD